MTATALQLTLPDTTEEIRTARERDRLAAEILALPDGTELAGSNLEKGLLVAQNSYERDPGLYAEIYERALRALNTTGPLNPERHASFLLEVLSGRRRQKGLQISTAKLTDNLWQALQILRGLTDSPRKMRLLGLAYYHGALLYRMTGQHDLAADCQRRALIRANEIGDKSSASTYLFGEQVELIHHALLRGEGNLEHLLGTLCEMHKVKSQGLQGTWDRSMLIHLYVLHWLAGVESNYVDEQFKLFLDGPLEDHWGKVLQMVVGAHKEGAYNQAIINAPGVFNEVKDTPSSSIQDALSLMALAVARSHREMLAPKAYEAYGQACTVKLHHGGHFVREVARRELAELIAER